VSRGAGIGRFKAGRAATGKRVALQKETGLVSVQDAVELPLAQDPYPGPAVERDSLLVFARLPSPQSTHTHTHDESRKKNPSGLIGHCSSIQLVMWIFCWTDLLDIHVAKSALKALAVHGRRRRTVRGGRLARSRFGPVRSGGTVDDDGLELEPRPAAAAILLRYSLQQQSTVAPTAHHALPDDGSLGMEKTAALRQPM
jgi:hypothetical protein